MNDNMTSILATLPRYPSIRSPLARMHSPSSPPVRLDTARLARHSAHAARSYLFSVNDAPPPCGSEPCLTRNPQ